MATKRDGIKTNYPEEMLKGSTIVEKACEGIVRLQKIGNARVIIKNRGGEGKLEFSADRSKDNLDLKATWWQKQN